MEKGAEVEGWPDLTGVADVSGKEGGKSCRGLEAAGSHVLTPRQELTEGWAFYGALSSLSVKQRECGLEASSSSEGSGSEGLN